MMNAIPTALRENTTLRTVLTATIVAAFGVFLIYCANTWKWFDTHSGWQATIEEVGAVFIASVALIMLWELFAKRAFVTELHSKIGVHESLDSAGLVGLQCGDFARDIDWKELVTGTRTFTMFVSYAYSWRNTNRLYLQELAQRNDAYVRILLPDPTNTVIMADLADRFEISSEKLISKIEEASHDFDNIFEDKPCTYYLTYVNVSPVYSFYVFDDSAIIALYKHRRDREYSPPSIIFKKGGRLWEFLDNELTALLKDDEPPQKAPSLLEEPRP